MTEPTDATLQQRCAEIVEWQRTGVLSGTALRAYAAEHWADHHDDLQMAERDTSARAMELIAIRGTPAEAVEVVATVIKKGADRQWMSERLGHLPDGIYSLYLAPSLTELQKDAAKLLFALHDAWPYVHESCTIRSVKRKIQDLMVKHGDFADLQPKSHKVDEALFQRMLTALETAEREVFNLRKDRGWTNLDEYTPSNLVTEAKNHAG